MMLYAKCLAQGLAYNNPNKYLNINYSRFFKAVQLQMNSDSLLVKYLHFIEPTDICIKRLIHKYLQQIKFVLE